MYIEYVGHASRDDSRNFDSLQGFNSLFSSNELLQLRNDIGGNESLGRRAAQANNHPSPLFPAISLGIFAAAPGWLACRAETSLLLLQGCEAANILLGLVSEQGITFQMCTLEVKVK